MSGISRPGEEEPGDEPGASAVMVSEGTRAWPMLGRGRSIELDLDCCAVDAEPRSGTAPEAGLREEEGAEGEGTVAARPAADVIVPAAGVVFKMRWTIAPLLRSYSFNNLLSASAFPFKSSRCDSTATVLPAEEEDEEAAVTSALRSRTLSVGCAVMVYVRAGLSDLMVNSRDSATYQCMRE